MHGFYLVIYVSVCLVVLFSAIVDQGQMKRHLYTPNQCAPLKRVSEFVLHGLRCVFPDHPLFGGGF